MYLLYSGTLFFWGLILCNLNSNWSTTYGRSWWSTFLKNSDSQICIQYLLETLGIYSLLSLKKQTKSIYIHFNIPNINILFQLKKNSIHLSFPFFGGSWSKH